MTEENTPTPKRKRGRPKGSKNRTRPVKAEARKVVTESERPMTFNEDERDTLTGDWRKERGAINKYGQAMPISRKRTSKYDIQAGDFVYLKDPRKKLVLSIVPLDNHQVSQDVLIDLLGDGYEFAKASEWDVRPNLRLMWKPNKSGYLTVSGLETKTMVLLWTTRENWERLQKEKTVYSDKVDKYIDRKLQSIHQGGQNPFIEGTVDTETETFEVVRS